MTQLGKVTHEMVKVYQGEVIQETKGVGYACAAGPVEATMDHM